MYKDVMSMVKMILFSPEKLKLRNISWCNAKANNPWKQFTVVLQVSRREGRFALSVFQNLFGTQ